MTISLVTGGAGFIGSHLVRSLLERGDQVRVFDNFSTGRRENLPQDEARLQVIEGDLRNPAEISSAVRGVEQVFHQAAFVSPPLSMEDPLTCSAINEQGTLNLLEAARREGVQRVVMASSCAVYGAADDLPLKEDVPVQPLSPYAASKVTNELYADLYTRVFNLPVVALRYFNVFGPRQRPDSPYAAAIPIFIQRMMNSMPPVVYGDGNQQRDFIYVKDVVRANLLAAEAPDAPDRVFNVCTGVSTSVLELLDRLKPYFPQAPEIEFSPPRPGDIYLSLGDPTRAVQWLNFRAQISLEEGLAKTVEWMRS